MRRRGAGDAWDAVVVGAGVGGSITAATLAGRGRSVLVLEEGPWPSAATGGDYTLEQMRSLYRDQGLSVALGRPPIAYAEARCVGGGSEVNSGLYHRPPRGLVDDWARRRGIADLSGAQLAGYAERIEAALPVTASDGPATEASRVLADGAASLGWSAHDVPRWFRRPAGGDRGLERRGMTATYLAQAISSGAKVLARCRVLGVVRDGPVAAGVVCRMGGRDTPVLVRAGSVHLCGGAVQSPRLLRRSGLRGTIGGSLALHPMAKIVAVFEPGLDRRDEVPTHQIDEFAPRMTLGGAASTPEQIALLLADRPGGRADVDHPGAAAFHVTVSPQARGRIHAPPGLGSPLIRYQLARADFRALMAGVERLARLLFAAGAARLYLPLRRSEAVTSLAQALARLADARPAGLALTAVHLTSSIGMSEDPAAAGADSLGRVHGMRNLHVNDASIVPGPPGVNPQGTVMALALRNAELGSGG